MDSVALEDIIKRACDAILQVKLPTKEIKHQR